MTEMTPTRVKAVAAIESSLRIAVHSSSTSHFPRRLKVSWSLLQGDEFRELPDVSDLSHMATFPSDSVAIS
jgi:hypothetical protein